MLLSLIWSQLQGSANLAAGINTCPGTSKLSYIGKAGLFAGGPRYANTSPANSSVGYAPCRTRSLSRLPPLLGRLPAAAVDVEHPAVVTAADAAREGDPVLQRGAAVGTVQVQHAGPASAGRPTAVDALPEDD